MRSRVWGCLSLERISGKRLEEDFTSSRCFLCFPQGKRMFPCRKTYVSASGNIRFREGRRTHQTYVPGKTKRRLANFFRSFEKPFLFRIFTVVIKTNADENKTVIVELGGHSRSVQPQSVCYTMDGPCRWLVYHGERVPWHRIGEQLQPVVTACSSLKNSQASGILTWEFFYRYS